MGRTDYIVQAGIGFDLDRSSASRAVSIFEGLANQMNRIASKASKAQFSDAEKDYDASMKSAKETSEKADADLKKSVTATAQATQKALQAASPPTPKEMKGKLKGDDLKEYSDAFKHNMKSMGSSYSKFQKEAAKIGLKVRKSEGGFGKGQSTTDFAQRDIEQRVRLIKLTERMVKDEKIKLSIMKETDKGYQRQVEEVAALERQGKSMRNLNDDIQQQEKQTDKIKRAAAKAERKADRKRMTMHKKIMISLKQRIARNKELGRAATDGAKKTMAGLKNVFVIGTAAAAAFFYKMQPLAESVQEFERTIINANSVFNVTKKELYEVSDSMVRFTLKYGVSAQDTATGLYQLASAGLSAAESQEVLQHTMKLAMATQGDHNTLAKLTVQTIMGFGMEMGDTAMLVDKFAHSIQKSLIEWEDLASSVKFAMPFFVATGQSIDELLGGLEVLTNRALEAGIAGRGLRQALAQFAKHADDNASAMRKLGIEIMDTEGNMRALHDIALDASAAFGDVTDLEALTIMLEDMNVRGATAFALLVQNADEFEAAVGNLANSAGEATLMADIQQQSLANQIQLVKNALMAPFLFADEVGEANDTLNAFTWKIQELVTQFTEFFIITLPDGTQALTEHSAALKTFIIEALGEAVLLIERIKEIFLDSGEGLTSFTELLHMAVQPLHIMLNIVEKISPANLAWIVKLKVLNSILPITNMLHMVGTYIMYQNIAAMMMMGKETEKLTYDTFVLNMMTEGHFMSVTKMRFAYLGAASGLWVYEGTMKSFNLTTRATMMAFGGMIAMFMMAITTTGALSDVFLALAGVLMILAMVSNFKWLIEKVGPLVGIPMAIIASIAMLGAMVMLRNKMQAGMGGMGGGIASGGAGPGVPKSVLPTDRMYDSGGMFTGGRMYDSGGPTTEHGLAILQRGETVIPKTRNMLDGGLTLNIGGDIVTDDAEAFAERIATALPEALRRQADIGGI